MSRRYIYCLYSLLQQISNTVSRAASITNVLVVLRRECIFSKMILCDDVQVCWLFCILATEACWFRRIYFIFCYSEMIFCFEERSISVGYLVQPKNMRWESVACLSAPIHLLREKKDVLPFVYYQAHCFCDSELLSMWK